MCWLTDLALLFDTSQLLYVSDGLAYTSSWLRDDDEVDGANCCLVLAHLVLTAVFRCLDEEAATATTICVSSRAREWPFHLRSIDISTRDAVRERAGRG